MNILNAINEIYENETAFEAMLSNGKHITIFRNSVGGIGTDSKATLTMSKEIVEADWKPVYIVQKIKIDPVFFEDIEKGVKTFELRNNDRDYKVGQVLNIGEYENKEFTGRYVKKQVCYVLKGFKGLEDNWCILGLTDIPQSKSKNRKQKRVAT